MASKFLKVCSNMVFFFGYVRRLSVHLTEKRIVLRANSLAGDLVLRPMNDRNSRH